MIITSVFWVLSESDSILYASISLDPHGNLLDRSIIILIFQIKKFSNKTQAGSALPFLEYEFCIPFSNNSKHFLHLVEQL